MTTRKNGLDGPLEIATGFLNPKVSSFDQNEGCYNH
jgi:hypothetical protein